MSWISKYTTIPIPEIVAYAFTVDNPIAHEYTLLSRVEGATLSDIYQTLDEKQISQILDQLIDFLTQLHAHEWDAIGGLNVSKHGDIVVGQVLDESFW
jgi:aminoglycoside phosphotransferase (APT) family kinase protein